MAKRAAYIPDGYTITKPICVEDVETFEFTFRVPSGAEVSDAGLTFCARMPMAQGKAEREMELDMSRFTGPAARKLLASKLVSWTLTTQGEDGITKAVPPTLESINRLDADVLQKMIDIMLSPVYMEDARKN